MKFLVIDDNDDQLQRAKAAAAEKGIEIITFNPNQKSDFLEFHDWPDDWRDVGFKSGSPYYPPTWTDAVRHLDVDGIVTDLVWVISHEVYWDDQKNQPVPDGQPKIVVDPEIPYGVLVHIEAAQCGKPVVICTDAVGHTGQSSAGWVLDYTSDPDCALRIERGKDWGNAFKMLIAKNQ